MTKEDVIGRIKKGGGQWLAKGGLKFTLDESDNTIHVRSEKFNGFWVDGADLKGFYLSGASVIEDWTEFLKFIGSISSNLNLGLNKGPMELPAEEVEETQPTEQDDGGRQDSGEAQGILKGKVEAYENLLIGRQINIGK